MHVYLLIFFVSFAQPLAYASAAPVLDFVEIRNFVRTAGAASADYLFKKSANDPTFNFLSRLFGVQQVFVIL